MPSTNTTSKKVKQKNMHVTESAELCVTLVDINHTQQIISITNFMINHCIVKALPHVTISSTMLALTLSLQR